MNDEGKRLNGLDKEQIYNFGSQRGSMPGMIGPVDYQQ
jgi:hypothetical protein